jgi:GTPase Era involved in 16S rRNA processing
MSKNIVIFGATGAGKSSVVNLMAGEERAETAPDLERCTLHWKEYPMAFDGHSYKVFDTIGLEEPRLGTKDYLNIIVNAHNLITNLQKEGGIDLLLFCVRAGRFNSTIQKNYRLFYEWLCEKNVPIALVLTGLEAEQNMADWWTKYKYTFDKYEILVDDQVCITAANGLDGRHQLQYEKSRRLIHNLVRKHTHDKQEVAWKGNEGWFTRFMHKLKGLFPDSNTLKTKNIVTVLTKRCGMPREDAVQLAEQVRGKPGCGKLST